MMGGPGERPLRGYAALGDGRSVAIVSEDGAVDWWCVPDMQSTPLFNRLIDAPKGGFFQIAPMAKFTVERRYLQDSNVHETIFRTAGGSARLIESLNSGRAGRLPWCELARRVEGLSGSVPFKVRIFSGQSENVPIVTLEQSCFGLKFSKKGVTAFLVSSGGIRQSKLDSSHYEGEFAVSTGQRETVALIAGDKEPLIIPSINDIDSRIDITHEEWCAWCDNLRFHGEYRSQLVRSALALKLLIFSPTGAIAASATTSLPEQLGASKNYDYRFAWVRDAGYSIGAFLAVGQQAEAKAAFTWLLKCIHTHGPQVLFALNGEKAVEVTELAQQGYRSSQPVRVGNDAAHQKQHGVYGDVLEIADRFVSEGHFLDQETASVLVTLANLAAASWRDPDAGIWENEKPQHFTVSKISCWQALDRAINLASKECIPADDVPTWMRERSAIVVWIDANCWSEAKQAYVCFPGSSDLDAAIALAVRFNFVRPDRIASSIRSLDRELGHGSFHYRGTGYKTKEGCFLACTLWIILAKSMLGWHVEAEQAFSSFLNSLGHHSGILPEMIDESTGEFLGNLPLGLTHLAVIQTVLILSEARNKAKQET